MQDSNQKQFVTKAQQANPSDIAVAMRYLIDTMQISGLEAFAEILEDIALQMENTSRIFNMEDKKNESISFISYYIAMKYARKINLDKHKKIALLELQSILRTDEDTL